MTSDKKKKCGCEGREKCKCIVGCENNEDRIFFLHQNRDLS